MSSLNFRSWDTQAWPSGSSLKRDLGKGNGSRESHTYCAKCDLPRAAPAAISKAKPGGADRGTVLLLLTSSWACRSRCPSVALAATLPRRQRSELWEPRAMFPPALLVASKPRGLRQSPASSAIHNAVEETAKP
eukprot:scaffold803_cov310-Pinguiococcus_pyrenoidosus.AAC.106